MSQKDRRRHRSSPSAAVRLPTFLLLVLSLSARSAAAQGADRNRMTVGDSVRIELSDRRTVAAEFRTWRQDGILLDVHGFARPYPVPLEDMERLDAYLLRTPRESFRHGAMLGAAGGLFVGAAVGVILNRTGVISAEDSPPSAVVTDAMRWMGLGIVGGALAGGFWASNHPSSGWIRIELPIP
ncbi:MAG: hypothetical protein R3304_04420 [Longimicrobiales bacterium]|nr:hypothetical protein [Longimicrobiales bacterium]